MTGNGKGIPRTPPTWYPCQTQNLARHNLESGSVANLIDSSSHTWKVNLLELYFPSLLVRKS